MAFLVRKRFGTFEKRAQAVPIVLIAHLVEHCTGIAKLSQRFESRSNMNCSQAVISRLLGCYYNNESLSYHVVVKPRCKSRKYLVHVVFFSVRWMGTKLCTSNARIVCNNSFGGRRMQPKFGALCRIASGNKIDFVDGQAGKVPYTEIRQRPVGEMRASLKDK